MNTVRDAMVSNPGQLPGRRVRPGRGRAAPAAGGARRLRHRGRAARRRRDAQDARARGDRRRDSTRRRPSCARSPRRRTSRSARMSRSRRRSASSRPRTPSGCRSSTSTTGWSACSREACCSVGSPRTRTRTSRCRRPRRRCAPALRRSARGDCPSAARRTRSVRVSASPAATRSRPRRPRARSARSSRCSSCDLVGFTDRSDRADPEDVRATLRPYHERVKADIERFGGTVEKFIGDAVMAVFGAPVAHEDDAERAVRAALADPRDDRGAPRTKGSRSPSGRRCTTGEAVVALGARPERGEGIVTGDVVNTAARLQSAAPVGTVIVDEATMRATRRGRSRTSRSSRVEAKGKAEPIPVWRATDARSRVGVEPEAATQTPFVGREHERDAARRDVPARAERESSVQLVTVVGEPGIGKSRLVRELRERRSTSVPTSSRGATAAACPYGEGITFWALGEIVKAEAGILESDDPPSARAASSRRASPRLVDGTRRHGSSAARAARRRGGRRRTRGREEAFTAWRRFLEALAAQRPLRARRRGPPLGRRRSARLPRAPPRLERAGAAPAALHRATRALRAHARLGRREAQRDHDLSLAAVQGRRERGCCRPCSSGRVLPAETQTAPARAAGGNPLYAEQFARMLAERDDVEASPFPRPCRRSSPPASTRSARAQVAAPRRGRRRQGVLAGAARCDRRARPRRGAPRPERARAPGVRAPGTRLLDRGRGRVLLLARARPRRRVPADPRAPRAEKHVAAARWVEETAGERMADHAGILVLPLRRGARARRCGRRGAVGDRGAPPHALLLAGDRAAAARSRGGRALLRRAVELAGERQAERASALAKLAHTLVDARSRCRRPSPRTSRRFQFSSRPTSVAAGVALTRLSQRATGR